MTKQMMVTIAIVAYLLFRMFIFEPGSLEINDYWIEDSALSGVKVVFLSDFNLKRRDFKRLNRIVRTTNKQFPDLVLLGGDFAYGHDFSKSMNMESVAQKLSLISAPKYAVLGDDDWYSNANAITTAMKKNDITVLNDSAVRTKVKGKYVDIIGVLDRSTHQPNITKALYKTKIPRIVLSHNPDIYYDVMEDVSLILAGHTHGGQVIIPFTPALFVPSQFGSDFASGLISSTHNKMIISKGLGTNKFPGRFNCKPEIVVVNFVEPGKAPSGNKR